jgi:hypothetical protein
MTEMISKRKTRSPKAPGMSLGQAIREVEKIYGAYGHAAFGAAEMASALGMSSDSGSFLAKIGTLREYCLIEGSGSDQHVSGLFRDIYAAQQMNDPALKQHAIAAVRSSDVFSILLQEFPTRIPDVGALAVRLEHRERFNRDRARVVAAAFRDSLAEFGLTDGSGNLLRPKETTSTPSGPEQDREIPEPGERISIGTSPGTFRVEVPLASGRRAILTLPDDYGAADRDRLMAVLGGFVPS